MLSKKLRDLPGKINSLNGMSHYSLLIKILKAIEFLICLGVKYAILLVMRCIKSINYFFSRTSSIY